MDTPGTEKITDLDARGFVHVRCAACSRDDVWLRCESCEKSDHFLFDGSTVSCSCGATYGHATCLCGEQVPAERLTFTAFKDGPMALADLEIDPARVFMIVVVLGALISAGIWFLR